MMLRVLSILTILFLYSVSSGVAQQRELSSTNSKAIAKYKSAIEAYDRFDYKLTVKNLKEAIEYDDQFIEAYLVLSQVYIETQQTEEAIAAAEGAIRINPDFFPNLYLNLGNALFNIGEYERALGYFNTFLGYQNIRIDRREFGILRQKSCEFALHALANPVPFTPINLGPNVNSKMDDYWPSLSADENTLVITVNVIIDTTSSAIMYNRQEDFFITNRGADGKWLPVRNIGPPINTPMFNEGAQSLTADGQRMYYTLCRGNCDLYASDRNPDGTWGRPQKLPEPVNLLPSSEKQPSISPDGQTLYFVSNRKSKKDTYDILRSHRLDDYHWSEPEDLGDSINTPYNEQSPFIHFDNQTLYFSSNGRVGMGGLDIFVSKMINDSTWSTPKNFVYPINTHGDEDGLIVNARGTMAYYSSDINPNMGRDIFKFELPEQVRPNPSSYITGTITDAKTGWPLKANFNLVDIDTKQEIMSTKALDGGEFFLCIPTNRNYAFFASMPGYLFHSEHFNLVGIHTADNPYRKDIELRPIRVGEVMVMRNIFFETAKYELKPESIVELSKLLELLKFNPTMVIEVGGHTDNVGTSDYNLDLSENRAKSVAHYLTEQGIGPERIKWKGYGFSKPIGDNATEDGRAQNRRTEIRVVGM
jgi:flagellar motor protein MotB